MRIDFIQKIIDVLRGKNKFLIKRPEFIIEKIYNNEIDILFDKFEYRKFTLNGEQRKHLTNLNAMRGVTESTLTLLCKLFPDKENRKNIKILNVGCGRKGQNEFIKELGFSAYGVDFDIENNTENLKFHDLNTQDDLPFDANMFDCVICQEIIEHIENPWLLFRKVKKMLKLGGHLIVTTPNIVSYEDKKYYCKNNYGYFRWFNEENMWQHINPIPYWEMIHIANYNGFELEKLTGNLEYYLKFKNKKLTNKEITLQTNNVVIYVFEKKDNEIKLYQPSPTYNHVFD